MKKVLVMELNELCPDLMARFISEGHLPNFQKLRDASLIRETETDATNEDLNPWVQWVDVHTGLERQEHGLTKLNEVNKFKGDFTWDILSKQYGYKNWICGSMNANYSDTFIGRFLPDPWCTDVEPTSNEGLNSYYNYISQSVQAHSKKENVSSGEFVKSLVKQGLGFSTAIKLALQLFKEKAFNVASWKRAMLLDQVQFDVFKHHYLEEKPEYSTFFSNAVAHYQHHYWRDFEPEKFTDISGPIDNEKKEAILLAYKNTDNIVGKLVDLVGEDTRIIFTTALSQKPYVKNERFYYHIVNKKRFFEFFAIPETTKYKPVMAEQFHLEAENEQVAIEIENKLESYVMDSDEYFHVGTKKLFLVTREKNIVFVQNRCTKNVNKTATFAAEGAAPNMFYDHFYQMDEAKTGCHDPVGIYWTRCSEIEAKVDNERVKPSQIHHDVLNYFSS